ncbi:sensor histidine kinase [Peribacillus sp. FSL H8-0477]|uniref:sensor histidine kinase n=1 Tax=Peribacillus sp. FSL H8-0477 TaxID=2921388 RepID=UPI0030FC4C39
MFILLIISLIVVIVYQYLIHRNQQRVLTSISEKLQQIMKRSSDEKLLIQTDDVIVKKLLIELNQLLEHTQTSRAAHLQTEDSMRRMLSNISHDLKTPLTVVMGYIEMITADPNLSKEETDVLLEKVHNKTVEVLNLMNKFFNLARLESGDIDMPLTRVNINEICRKNILAYYDVLSAKGFTVELDIPEEPLYVLGNEVELERILNNLLSNSIRYGSDGLVIGLNVRSTSDMIYVDVWDKGKGMNEIDQNRIFERMYTLEDSRNKLYQGSGLGLTITKRLIEQLGGEITLHSVPFERTTFTFSLKRVTF